MANTHDDDDFEDLPVSMGPDDQDELTDDEDGSEAAVTSGEPDEEPLAAETANEDEDAEYGRKVKKRIAKEVSKRKRIETEFATKQAQYEQYIANLHQRLESVEQRFSEADARQSSAELEATLADIKERRKAAWDDGDIDTYHALEDEYLDARMAVRQAGKAEPTTPRTPPPTQQPPPQTAGQPPLPAPMRDWMETNQKWFNGDPANRAKVDVANSLFNAMKAEGFGEDDPELYAEFDKRLVAAGIKAPRRTAAATVAPNRYAGANEHGPRKGFTQADMATMRKYGMDPNNPAHRAAYLNRNAPL